MRQQAEQTHDPSATVHCYYSHVYSVELETSGWRLERLTTKLESDTHLPAAPSTHPHLSL